MSEQHPRDPLPVCPRCGWHKPLGHDDVCWPDAGAAAQRLIDFLALQNITATKLGYGQHSVAFESSDETLTVILEVSRDGRFGIDGVYGSGRMTETDAGKLAVALEMFTQSRAPLDA